MYKLYQKPFVTAFPDVKVSEPRVSRRVLYLIRLLGRLYLFLFYGVARTVLQDDHVFIKTFKKAMDGQSRCILAFRHPNGGEPQLLTWFILFRLWFYALRRRERFSRWPHAVFVYGYEVVRWGGWIARYIMPNLGAMPVHHSKMDSKGMARIYKAIIEGSYPLAIAPEGQVSYTNDSIPRLESGIIRIGFRAAMQLEEKNKNCPVEILPVSFHFRYGSWGRLSIKWLLKKIEKLCGFSRTDAKNLSFIERLNRCRNHILEVNENRYNITFDASLSFEERLERVVFTALETAESLLGIKIEGDFFARLYNVRQICWDRIFLPGIDNLKKISGIERSVKDLGAGESWYISRHQELADFGWYFCCPLPTEETAFHNMVEYVQNLWDFASRTMGGALSNRVNIFAKKVIIQAGEVINLTERLPEYKKDKKAAVASSLADLERSYLDIIEKMNRTEQG